MAAVHYVAPHELHRRVAGAATLLAVSATRAQPLPAVLITVDALDAERVAAFWCEALGYRRLYERPPYIVCAPPDGDPRPRLNVQHVAAHRDAKPTVHIDIVVDDALAAVDQLTALGAQVVEEIDERDLGGSRWTVLTDPEGNPLCVVASRSRDTNHP